MSYNEEEEITFEGDQIHKYLTEIGVTEFEVTKRAGFQVEQNEKQTLTAKGRVVNLLNSAWSWFSEDWWIRTSMDASIHCEQVNIILKSGLLFEEDICFLQSLMADLREYAERARRINPVVKSILLCSLGSLSCWYYKAWNRPIAPIAASGTGLLYVLWCWRKSYQRKQWKSQQEQCINCLKEFLTVVKKSTKLVQEKELVLRGFTLARSGSIISRLENSELPCMAKRWQSLPGLRKGIALATIGVIDILKAGTQDLVHYCPLNGQLDNTHHYLSFLSHETLGLPKQEAIDNEAELKLNLLKRLHHIYLLLQSEFLRRLALCFSPDSWKRKSSCQIASVMEIINHIHVSCSDLQSNLSREYKVFYSYGVCDSIQSKSPIPINESKSREYSDIYVAVHSTGLHLQAILFRIRTLEELLESQAEDEVDLTGLSENLQLKITDILQELEACKSCCEECLSQLSKLGGSPSVTDSKPQVGPNSDENVNEPPVEVIRVPVGFTDLDPKGEDEIYEAVIYNRSDGDFQEEELTVPTQEELLKQVREKEASARVVQELKSVLVDKAQEWREREAKVLEHKQGRHEMFFMKNGKIIVDNCITKDKISGKANVKDVQLSNQSLNMNDSSTSPALYQSAASDLNESEQLTSEEDACSTISSGNIESFVEPPDDILRSKSLGDCNFNAKNREETDSEIQRLLASEAQRNLVTLLSQSSLSNSGSNQFISMEEETFSTAEEGNAE